MKAIIISLLLFFGIALTGYPQTIVNGSFEEWPDSCVLDTPPVGWTHFGEYSYGPDQRGIYCDGNITPYEGDHYMGLVGCFGTAIMMEGAQQEISGLVPGNMYTVSFYATADDYTTHAVDLKVWAYIDSMPVFESYYLIENEPWKHYQFVFTAENATADLAFLSTDLGNTCLSGSVGIDQVTIHEGVGVLEGGKIDFAVYPNPASDILFINSSKDFNEKVQILNVSGHVVLETDAYTDGIDISQLEAGIYFLRFENEQSKTERFVKR